MAANEYWVRRRAREAQLRQDLAAARLGPAATRPPVDRARIGSFDGPGRPEPAPLATWELYRTVYDGRTFAYGEARFVDRIVGPESLARSQCARLEKQANGSGVVRAIAYVYRRAD